MNRIDMVAAWFQASLLLGFLFYFAITSKVEPAQLEVVRVVILLYIVLEFVHPTFSLLGV